MVTGTFCSTFARGDAFLPELAGKADRGSSISDWYSAQSCKKFVIVKTLREEH